MEIRIGIRENQRDLAFETNLSPAQVSALVTNAFAAKQDLVSFEDDKGKEYVSFHAEKDLRPTSTARRSSPTRRFPTRRPSR